MAVRATPSKTWQRVWEPYSETPRPSMLMDCVTKSLTLMRIRNEKTPPRLWVLSPGVPRTGLRQWRARRNGGRWVKGFYSLPSPLNAHIIVLSELPPGPETLILRLLGRSPVWNLALQEARATIPQFAKHPVGKVLARWHRIAVETENPTAYQQELIMDPEAIRLADEYFENARKEGRDQERLEGLQRYVLKIFVARHGEAPEALCDVVEHCRNIEQLDSWLTLVATQSREDVLTQILHR